MERLHRFILHRWVQIAVHLLVIAALTGALFATHVADGYFNRGVASGADAQPIPYTDVNPLAVNTFLDQEADPAKFTVLLKAAYTAAKAADPSIVVLMPGLAPTDQTGPTNLSDLLFLQGMYDAGAKDYFDVASVMVYGYGYSPYDRRVEFARDNFSRPIQTREIMVKNGDADKPVWASEYGWVSLPRDWAGDPSPWGNPVSLEKQAKYLYQGYLRAQQEWPWMGVMAVWNFRTVQPPTDPNQAGNPTRGFSIVNYDFSPTPAYTLLQQAAPKLDRAYTGAYTAASPRIEQSGNWALNGSGASATLVPQQDGAQATINFSGTRLDLELAGGSSSLRVAIDGGNARTVKAGSGKTTRVTVADGLSDGPHQALITATATGAQSTTLAGFVVVRRTINSWIYPWIYATLALLLLLNLASLVWAILRNRVTSSSLPEIDHVFSAADLRKARGPTQHR
jgi:hypothetical protein